MYSRQELNMLNPKVMQLAEAYTEGLIWKFYIFNEQTNGKKLQGELS